MEVRCEFCAETFQFGEDEVLAAVDGSPSASASQGQGQGQA